MESRPSSKRTKSQVVSIRLRGEQLERLRRFARLLGATASEAAALLVEEGLRRSEFAFIDFRNSSAGRQAFMQGSRVTVWQVIMIARAYGMDVQKTAEHLQCPDFRVQAALNYYSSFPSEIEEALEENASYDFRKLQQMLPQIQAFTAAAPTKVVAEKCENEYNKTDVRPPSQTAKPSPTPGKKRSGNK